MVNIFGDFPLPQHGVPRIPTQLQSVPGIGRVSHKDHL